MEDCLDLVPVKELVDWRVTRRSLDLLRTSCLLVLLLESPRLLPLQLRESSSCARTRLANDAKGKGGERQFNGLIDVYTKTLKSDGIQGLYRGFAISAVGIFIYRGMYFGLFDTLKPLLLGDQAN